MLTFLWVLNDFVEPEISDLVEFKNKTRVFREHINGVAGHSTPQL